MILYYSTKSKLYFTDIKSAQAADAAVAEFENLRNMYNKDRLLLKEQYSELLEKALIKVKDAQSKSVSESTVYRVKPTRRIHIE